jgi:hypothetical protein
MADDSDEDNGDNNDFLGSLNYKPNMRIRQVMNKNNTSKASSRQSKATQGQAPQEGPLTHVGGEEEGEERCVGTLRGEEGKGVEQVTGPALR